MQHEKVMGSVCCQNAIGPIHALQAKVAALTHGKVNIRVQLKENQCTPSFFIKMSIFMPQMGKHSNFL